MHRPPQVVAYQMADADPHGRFHHAALRKRLGWEEDRFWQAYRWANGKMLMKAVTNLSCTLTPDGSDLAEQIIESVQSSPTDDDGYDYRPGNYI